MEAAFVQEAGGKVILKKPDGGKVEIPLNRLSEGDQKYIADLQATAQESQSPGPDK